MHINCKEHIATSGDALVPNSFLLLVVMPLLLVAMHLLLVAMPAGKGGGSIHSADSVDSPLHLMP